MSWGHNGKLNALVGCEFASKSNEVRTDGNIQGCDMRVVESSSDDDNLTISEFSRKRRLQKKGITVPGNQELLPSIHSQYSSPLNDETARERETLIESKPEKLKTTNGKSDEDGNEAYVVKERMPQESMDKNDKGDCKLNLPDSIELGSEGLINANRSDGYA